MMTHVLHRVQETFLSAHKGPVGIGYLLHGAVIKHLGSVEQKQKVRIFRQL
jgi:hypothetical protein